MGQDIIHYKELLNYKKCLLRYAEFDILHEMKNHVRFTFEETDKKFLDEYELPQMKKEQSEIDYIFTIISWMNRKIVHDGYTKYRGKMNAVDLLNYCCHEKKGVNCLMNAIILQEICLSMGYIAYLVQGNPYDYKIMDCHWLVNVYLTSYEKWVIFDPVWFSCCFNDKGEPLSIYEIRNSLCTNQKIVFYKECKCDYYYYLLCRYYFFFGLFKYNGYGTFDMENQQKFYFSPKDFDSRAYINSKEKERFQPFDLKEYLYFSRHEEKSIHLQDSNDKTLQWEESCISRQDII